MNHGDQGAPDGAPMQQDNQQFNALMEQINNLRQEVVNLQQTQPQPQYQQQPDTPATRGIIKTHNPEEYNGNKASARRFLSDCQSFLGLNEHVYVTDKQKILYVLSYMRSGSAAEFKEHILEAAKDHGHTSWDTFISTFEKPFLTSDIKGEAMTELAHLKQGQASADEYVQKFKMLAARAKLNDYEALLQYFLTGLNQPLFKKVEGVTGDFPETMDGVYELTQRLDNRWRRFNQLAGRRNTTTYAQRDTPINRGDPMDVDRVRVGRLSPEEHAHCLKQGLCFRCRRPSHQKGTYLSKFHQMDVHPRAFPQRHVRAQPEPAPAPVSPGPSGLFARVAAICQVMEGLSTDEQEEVVNQAFEKGFV